MWLRASSLVARQLEESWRGPSALLVYTGNLAPFPLHVHQTMVSPVLPPWPKPPEPSPLHCQAHPPPASPNGCNPICASSLSRIPFLTLRLSSPSRIHSRCSLVLSFSLFRGIVIGCALIRISPRMLRCLPHPETCRLSPQRARLGRRPHSLKCAVSKSSPLVVTSAVPLPVLS